jgi:uncharacterized protein (DUF1919 family)
MKLYSIISNSCLGLYAHKKLYPTAKYVNGFMSTLIHDDEQFVELAENGASINSYAIKLCHDRKQIRYPPPVTPHPNFPFAKFGPVDISFIHSHSGNTAIDQFNRRQERGASQKVEHIFVLCVHEMFQGRNDTLINRFLNIPHKSVLLTFDRNDLKRKYDRDKHFVYVMTKTNDSKIPQTRFVDAFVHFARTSSWFFDDDNFDKVDKK